jgi:hypothetical protein
MDTLLQAVARISGQASFGTMRLGSWQWSSWRRFCSPWAGFHEAFGGTHQVLADHDCLCPFCGRGGAVVGLEAVLAFLFGVAVFSESCGPARIAGVLLITLGILSLRSAL